MEMFRYDELPESENDKQIVYKINGDFVGDVKGNNVIVILMGDGDFVGDIDSKDGEVILIKGNINGDVKANKIVCPTKPKQVKCSDCVHVQKQRFLSLSCNRECNVCSQFGVKVDDNYRNCQLYKPINRHNDDNTTKHNPAKDVESPELPVRPKSLDFYKSNRLEPKMSILKW